MKRVSVAVLSALWGLILLGVYLLTPTWLGWGPPTVGEPGNIFWWVFGWVPLAFVAYLPVHVYESSK